MILLFGNLLECFFHSADSSNCRTCSMMYHGIIYQKSCFSTRHFFFPQFCLLVQVVQVLCRTRWGMASSDLECWFRGFDGHRRGVFSTAWSSAVKAEGEQFGRWTWTCPKAIPKGSRIIFQPSIVRCYVYVSFREGNSYRWLAGGFKYFACSSLFWEMIQFE